MFKKNIVILFFCFTATLVSGQQVHFNDYFSAQRLRFDYFLSGNVSKTHITGKEFWKEPHWGGSFTNLVDTFYYGEMYVEVFDSVTNKLIYSRGYATLFNEWQGTKEAREGADTAFNESIIIPYPHNTILIQISLRDSFNTFHKLFDVIYNPDKTATSLPDNSIEPRLIYDSGESQNSIDIVLVPSGYGVKDSMLYFQQVEGFVKYLFKWKPYNRYKKNFNVWIIPAFSNTESHVDISYNTLNMERYLMPVDYQQVCSVISAVPYDQIVIIANSTKYGGGGIYNYCCTYSAGNQHAEYLFHHEFAHSFACLADEYYDSPVSYEGLYSYNVEPYRPNITTLVDFETKWKASIKKNVPIPTPETKKYKNKIGVFEGASYSAKGIYRPTLKSSMSDLLYNEFGSVNEQAIENMLQFYIQ